MKKEICLPPEWQTVPIICPDCKAQLRARFVINNGPLEALRCESCDWSQSFVKLRAQRRARLAALRKRLIPSSAKQTRTT